jgi:hypothetical protein
MRVLRACLIGACVLALMGSGGVAVGQGETAPMSPSFFTFSLEPTETTSDEREPQSADSSAGEVAGVTETEAMEASDTCASGVLTTILSSNEVTVDGGGLAVIATSQRLVTDGGARSGTGRSVVAFVDDHGLISRSAVLLGEDAYGGLTMGLHQYFDDSTRSLWGVIVPSVEMPPQPGLGGAVE